jgi:expansin (peptidoglycan-binding protein)
MQVKIKDGSNPWWFALLASNVGGSGAVTKIELQSGSAWVKADRQDYNYWLATSGSGLQFPLGVRVWQGTQNVTGTIASPSGVFSLSSNFASESTTTHDGGCFIPNKQ